MKEIITILLLLTCSIFAQIKGTSKAGRLVPLQSGDKMPPQIKVIEPSLAPDAILAVNQRNLSVKMQVTDEGTIDRVLINGIKASMLNNTEYSALVNLDDGLNTINIQASDVDGNTADFSFQVNLQSDIAGPVVKIFEPSVTRGMKVVHQAELLTVKGIAVDESGIFEVTINNIKAEVTPSGEFTAAINLRTGDNHISVRSIDRKYNVSTDTFTVTKPAEEVITPGRYIALVIGIDKYKGIWPELQNAVNDAKAMTEILQSSYHFDEVIGIFDEEATRANIIRKIEQISSQISASDNFLIFYSGHGELNAKFNKGYWVPADALTNSTAEMISNSEIQTYINGIPARHTLLVSDACFSGDIFRSGKTDMLPYEASDRYYKEVYRRFSRAALTSGGLEPVADGGRDGHSVFTYYLLKALRENNTKYLTTGQIFNEIAISVSNNSGQTPVYQPIKNTGDEGGEFIFIKR